MNGNWRCYAWVGRITPPANPTYGLCLTFFGEVVFVQLFDLVAVFLFILLNDLTQISMGNFACMYL